MADDLPVYSVPEGSAEDLADLLGVTSRQIREMAKKGFLVKIRRGVYDLRESVKAYYDQRQGKAPSSNVVENGDPLARSVSSSELADLLGISPRWVQKLTVDGTLKKNAEDRYGLAEAVQGYCEYLRGATKSNQGDLDAETLRLTRAKADKAEISVEMLLGETVRIEAVGQMWGDLVTVFRSRMLGLPNKMAAILALKEDPAEIRNLIMEEVRDALEDLARFDPEDVVERALPEDPEDDESPSETDGIGMGG
jgi:phage terminase Nu1 subunit (DNA packaging protein)